MNVAQAANIRILVKYKTCNQQPLILAWKKIKHWVYNLSEKNVKVFVRFPPHRELMWKENEVTERTLQHNLKDTTTKTEDFSLLTTDSFLWDLRLLLSSSYKKYRVCILLCLCPSVWHGKVSNHTKKSPVRRSVIACEGQVMNSKCFVCVIHTL